MAVNKDSTAPGLYHFLLFCLVALMRERETVRDQLLGSLSPCWIVPKTTSGLWFLHICHATGLSPSKLYLSWHPSLLWSHWGPLLLPHLWVLKGSLSIALYSSTLHTVLSWWVNSPFICKAQYRDRAGPWPSLYSHGLIKVWHAGRLISVFQIDGWMLMECLALPTCWHKLTSYFPAWERALFTHPFLKVWKSFSSSW